MVSIAHGVGLDLVRAPNEYSIAMSRWSNSVTRPCVYMPAADANGDSGQKQRAERSRGSPTGARAPPPSPNISSRASGARLEGAHPHPRGWHRRSVTPCTKGLPRTMRPGGIHSAGGAARAPHILRLPRIYPHPWARARPPRATRTTTRTRRSTSCRAWAARARATTGGCSCRARTSAGGRPPRARWCVRVYGAAKLVLKGLL
jgi:hypothetical protein